MPSSFWLLARKPRLIEWLMLLPLAVFFFSTQIVMKEEGRIFADPLRHVSNASHSVPLELKGDIFYVSQKDKETHDLAERLSFGAIAVLFIGIALGRRSRRNVAQPQRVS